MIEFISGCVVIGSQHPDVARALAVKQMNECIQEHVGDIWGAHIFEKDSEFNWQVRVCVPSINKAEWPAPTNAQPASLSKADALKAASDSLVQFMNTQCCPHDMVIVQQGTVQLFNGEIGLPFPIPD